MNDESTFTQKEVGKKEKKKQVVDMIRENKSQTEQSTYISKI